jgi:hypothetical protein
MVITYQHWFGSQGWFALLGDYKPARSFCRLSDELVVELGGCLDPAK